MPYSYLTEELLGDFLKEFYTSEWIRNKQFIEGKIRPDYRNDTEHLIIEFDGYLHYTKASQVIRDKEKDILYRKHGYHVIRIPYFIQLSNETIKLLLNKNLNCIFHYPHGFIDSKAVLPCDFCELGVQRFLQDLDKYTIVKNDIIKSLKNKVTELGDINKVLPPSIQYLIERNINEN